MRYKIFLIVLLAAAVVAGCAKAGMPSGGPKDVTPPQVLGAEPPSGTTDWTAREFAILFDEYVTVKDANNNILVSPPMNTKPEYTTKGHALVVKLKDSLHTNTTYLFQFKEGIVDFNEGNPLSSYEYVFSTGSSIDSMTLRGQVLDALTHQPYKTEGAITVVAYSVEQMSRFDSLQTIYLDSLQKADTTGTLAQKLGSIPVGDSLVAKVKPMYMTRCDKEGHFAMNHLREGRYKVLAFDDSDNNLLLKAGEAAAFLDTLVLAEHMPPPQDTTKADSTSADSTTAAAPLSIQNPEFKIQNFLLRISLHKEEAQRLTKAEFKERGHLMLTTALPLTQHYTLQPLDTHDRQQLYIRPSTQRDTLHIWTENKDCDSLMLLLTDKGLQDTIKLTYRAPKPLPGGNKLSGKGMSKGGSLLSNKVAAKHPYYDTLWIAFSRPVKDIAHPAPDSLVSIFNLEDSTISYCGVKWADTCHPTGHFRAMIDFMGKPGGKYRMKVPAMSFRDIYDTPHQDSLTINTEFTKVEDYGNIIVSVQCTMYNVQWDAPLLIQLLNEKGEVQRQQTIHGASKVEFNHLKGGKYALRAIVDRDSNGSWTAGDYWNHRQPEEVVYFEKILELRENWDMEEHWDIKPSNNPMPTSEGEKK